MTRPTLFIILAVTFAFGSISSEAALVGWYTFDEAAGALQADDSSENDYHGRLEAFDYNADSDFVPDGGRFDGAIHFDGADDRAVNNSLPHPTDAFTYAFWFKPDNDMNAGDGRVDFAYSNYRPHFTFDRDTGHEGKIGLYYDISGDDATSVIRSTTTSWAAGKWHHLAFAFDGLNVRLYVDGVQENSTTRLGTQHVNPGIAIGSKTGVNPFDGLIDDFAIWDEALTPRDVTTIYNDGVAAFAPATLIFNAGADGLWGSTTAWDNGPPNLPDATTNVVIPDHTVTVDTDGFARSVTVSGGGIAIDDGQSLAVETSVAFSPGTTLNLGDAATLNAGGGKIGSVDVSDDAIIASAGLLEISSLDLASHATFTKKGQGVLSLQSVTAGVNATVRIDEGTLRAVPGAYPLGTVQTLVLGGGTLFVADAGGHPSPGPQDAAVHLAFDETSGNVAHDATDHHRHGALSQFPADNSQWVSGRVGGALQLDGHDDLVTIHDYMGVGGSNARTVAAWIKSNDYDGTFASWGRDAFGDGGGRWTSRLDNGRLRTDCHGGYHRTEDSTYFKDASQWHHVAVVFPEGETTMQAVQLYVDGLRVASHADAPDRTVNTNVTHAHSSPVQIGRDVNDNATRWFAGQIDEFYVYERALTPEEITAMSGSWIAPNMLGTDVVVTADSAIEADSNSNASLGTLTMQAGTLTTTGTAEQISFNGTIIDPDVEAVGFNPLVPTDYGVINGNGASVVISKSGPGDLTLAAANTGLQRATFRVEEGTLTMAQAEAWGGATAISLGGGTFVVADAGLEDLNLTTHRVEVDGAATLRVSTTAAAAFDSLKLNNGSLLTIKDTAVSFAATTIASDAVAVGVDLQTEVDFGAINGNNAAAVVTVRGTSDAILWPGDTIGADNLTLNIDNCRMVGVADRDENPFATATLQIDGGELVLVAEDHQQDVTFENELVVDTAGTLTVGPAGIGGQGPLTISLGNEAHGITCNGHLSVHTRDGYRLSVPGAIGGTGRLDFISGELSTTKPISLAELNVAGTLEASGVTADRIDVQPGGRLDSSGPTTVANLDVGGIVNTNGNPITVTDSLMLGVNTFTIGTQHTFAVTGHDLQTAAEITVDGGLLHIAPQPSRTPGTVFLVSDGPPTGKDAPLVSLLESLGYTVDTGGMNQACREVFAPFGNRQLADAMNAADLVLVSRHTDSNSYDSDRQNWNVLETPLLLINGYLIPAGNQGDEKWGWTTGGTSSADASETDVLVQSDYQSHPFLDGLTSPVRLFDWSPDPAAPGAVCLPDPGTHRPGADLIGTLDGRPYLIDIPPGTEFGEGYGTTAERRVFMGHWGYNLDQYEFDDFITDEFGALLANVLLDMSPLSTATSLAIENVDLVVTDDTTLHIESRDVATIGNLTIDPAVAVTLTGQPTNINDLYAGHDARVEGADVGIGGVLSPGGSAGNLGVLDFDGRLELLDEATYVCEIGNAGDWPPVARNGDPPPLPPPGAGNDLIHNPGFSGSITLAGKLELIAIDKLHSPQDATPWYGREDRVVMNVADDQNASIGYEFAALALDVHLGHGVFLVDPGVIYNGSDVTVSLLQAGPGDANGDRRVDFADVWALLTSGKYNTELPATWPDGDFNDDRIADFADVWVVLTGGLYNAGEYGYPDDHQSVAYAATNGKPADNATLDPIVVAEPTSLVLFAVGLVALLLFRQLPPRHALVN